MRLPRLSGEKPRGKTKRLNCRLKYQLQEPEFEFYLFMSFKALLSSITNFLYCIKYAFSKVPFVVGLVVIYLFTILKLIHQFINELCNSGTQGVILFQSALFLIKEYFPFYKTTLTG